MIILSTNTNVKPVTHTIEFSDDTPVPEHLKPFVKENKVTVVPAESLAELRNLNVNATEKAQKLESLIKPIVETLGVEDLDEFDPNMVVENISKLNELQQQIEDGKIEASDKIKSEVETRLKTVKEAHEKKLKEEQERIANLAKQLEEKERTIIDLRMGSEISNLFNDEELGLEPTAVKGLRGELYEVFSYDAEKGIFIGKDPQTGKVLWDEDGVTPLSMRNYVDTVLRSQARYLFKRTEENIQKQNVEGYSPSELSQMSAEDLWNLQAQLDEKRL